MGVDDTIDTSSEDFANRRLRNEWENDRLSHEFDTYESWYADSIAHHHRYAKGITILRDLESDVLPLEMTLNQFIGITGPLLHEMLTTAFEGLIPYEIFEFLPYFWLKKPYQIGFENDKSSASALRYNRVCIEDMNNFDREKDPFEKSFQIEHEATAVITLKKWSHRSWNKRCSYRISDDAWYIFDQGQNVEIVHYRERKGYDRGRSKSIRMPITEFLQRFGDIRLRFLQRTLLRDRVTWYKWDPDHHPDIFDFDRYMYTAYVEIDRLFVGVTWFHQDYYAMKRHEVYVPHRHWEHYRGKELEFRYLELLIFTFLWEN